MKPGDEQPDLDAIDLQILALLQEHSKTPFAKIGERVGLSAPAVMERIKKLEDSGVITSYPAILDAKKLGHDITAFIGVSITHPKLIQGFEQLINNRTEVLECHHVTGGYTLLLKLKTFNTSTLEELISFIRSIDGVGRTETMVVLSTHTERSQLVLRQEPEQEQPAGRRRGRRNGERLVLQQKTAS